MAAKKAKSTAVAVCTCGTCPAGTYHLSSMRLSGQHIYHRGACCTTDVCDGQTVSLCLEDPDGRLSPGAVVVVRP